MNQVQIIGLIDAKIERLDQFIFDTYTTPKLRNSFIDRKLELANLRDELIRLCNNA
jgi:hypothetical protein